MKKIIVITLFLSIAAIKISAAEYEVAAVPRTATLELIAGNFDSQTLLDFHLIMELFDKYQNLEGLAQLQAITGDIMPLYRSADSAILMNLFALADLLQMKHLAELVSLVFIIKTQGMDTELQKKEAHQIYLSLLKKQAFLSAHTFIKYFNSTSPKSPCF